MPANPQTKTKSPALVWDGFGLQSLHSGVGRHAWALLQELLQRGLAPQILASAPHIDPAFQPWLKNLRWPLSRLKPWSLFVAARSLKSIIEQEPRQTYIVHGLSNYNLPAVYGKNLRKVLTVHDLIPFKTGSQVSSALSFYLNWQLPRALQAADAIICVSRWTERELLERFPSVLGRTHVIPNGRPEVVPKFQDKERRSSLKMLTVARHERYKRLSLIPAILGQLSTDASWILVTDEGGKRFLSEASRIDPRLQLRTHLLDAELDQLHQEAAVYVHPSLWEGFCLPAAASLSCGVPVIHTSGSGIDEVVGAAGIALPADATATDWALAIANAFGSSTFAVAAQQQCQNSASWPEVAARILELYATLGEL